MFKVNKKLRNMIIVFSAATVTAVTAAVAAFNDSGKLSDNPWEHTLLSAENKGFLINESGNLSVKGNVYSNGSIKSNGKNTDISGYTAAAGDISGNITCLQKYENTKQIDVPNVWNNVYNTAHKNSIGQNDFQDYEGSSATLNDISESSGSINIVTSSEIAPSTLSNNESNIKIGAFGADFFVKAYENRKKWDKILPIFFDEEFETNSLKELGENSRFTPFDDGKTGTDWKDKESVSGSLIGDNFSDEKLKKRMEDAKKDNPVFKICGSKSDAVCLNASFNPEEAENACKLTVNGGNFTLDGNYDKLEELKLDNWGGSQLIGDYPDLKYIYKTGYGDLNLAGNFPSLECVYTPSGQVLLGSGDEGFSADNMTVINDYGSVIMYTAKDVSLTNSRIYSGQYTVIRGSGIKEKASALNAENTLFAASNSIMIEDINDSNNKRYADIPVFYSANTISVVNCNFKILQGMFINNKNALIMANVNVDVFRGFLFSAEGIDENRNSSASVLYINTFGYNKNPNINSLNSQPSGHEKIGGIDKFEYCNFPQKLAAEAGDAENFVGELQNKGVEVETKCENPGETVIGDYILSKNDINITADKLTDTKNHFSVIASKNGNITLNVKNEINIHAIIYAPNGKVTINSSKGKIYGRIFAGEINIVYDCLEIDGGSEDISYLGFKNAEDDSSEISSINDSDESDADSESSDVSESRIYDSSMDDLDNNSSNADFENSSDINSGEDSKDENNSSELSSETDSSGGYKEPKYEYDKLNRLIKVIYDKDNYIEYEYDANGNITKVTTVKNGIKE